MSLKGKPCFKFLLCDYFLRILFSERILSSLISSSESAMKYASILDCLITLWLNVMFDITFQVAVALYKSLGYVVYREIINYYGGSNEENAYG